jgi:hypothetical protein
MSNLISTPVALEPSVLQAVQQAVIDGYTETKSAFEGLQASAQQLIGHCVAVDSLVAINEAAAALAEGGHSGFAGNLRSWGSRAMIGVVNVRDANILKVGAKRIEAGLPLAFTPEFTANPNDLSVADSKTRGEKKVAKPVDPKALLRMRKAIRENGLGESGKYSIEQIAAVNAAMTTICDSLGIL